MTTPIPLVYFDKGKAPRVVDPLAFWPGGKWKRAGGPDPVPAMPAKPRPGVFVAMDLGSEPGRTVAFVRADQGAVHVLEMRRDGVRLDGEPVRCKPGTVTPEEQAEAERRQAAVQGYLQVGERLEKPRRRAKKAPPAAEVPRPLAPPPPEPAPSPEARQAAAVEALREYLRLHDRGGHLAPWLRDGKRHRVVDARDQAYARGDASTRGVAGALLALTREQFEAVRRSSGVSADIGRVRPEGET